MLTIKIFDLMNFVYVKIHFIFGLCFFCGSHCIVLQCLHTEEFFLISSLQVSHDLLLKDLYHIKIAPNKITISISPLVIVIAKIKNAISNVHFIGLIM